MKNRNWLGMTMHRRTTNRQMAHKIYKRPGKGKKFSNRLFGYHHKRHRLIFRAHQKFNIPIALYA